MSATDHHWSIGEVLSLLPAGQEITIKFKRKKRTKRFKVKLADKGR